MPAEYELLCRLIKGDRNAFDAIYHQYFHAVYCNAMKITRDKAAAEDILQEIFITLWEKREAISTERPIGGWLFVLSYNKSINLLRKNLRESTAYQRMAEPAGDEQLDELKYSYQWQLLETALAQLSPQKRRVFELCKIQGRSYEETAADLQISKYTVKEYLSSAVTFIKEYVHHHPQSYVASASGLFLAVLSKTL